MNRLIKIAYELDKYINLKYVEMFNELNDPKSSFHANSERPATLLQCPAGKNHHHYWEGGLVDHLSEMFDFAKTVYKTSEKLAPLDFTMQDVATLILVHDISKAITFEYAEKPNGPKIFDYRKGFFDHMGWDHRSLWLLSQFGISLSEQHYIALLHTEGGWSEQARMRKDGNMLSKFMHVLDMYSSQLVGGKFTLPFSQNKEKVYAESSVF